MEIKIFQLGPLQTNCYVVSHESEALIVDPGGDPSPVIGFLDKNELKAKAILLTHGHGDHIGGVKPLVKRYDCPLHVGEGDVEMITNAALNLSAHTGGETTLDADGTFSHGDSFPFAGMTVEVIGTPGHTKGGLSYRFGDVLFSGDTLFLESIGRTDLHGGDQAEIVRSIKQNLYRLPDETKVYPGHGPATTIGHEKKHNPYVR